MRKKRIILIIVVILVLLLVGSLIYLNIFPENGAKVDGNIVDNELNNLAAGGNLVRIGDKLYYNYTKNQLKYGLVEITEEGSNRIFWNGPILLDYNYLLQNIRTSDDELISLYNDDSICKYSFDEGSFIPDEKLNDIPDVGLYFYTKDNVTYFIENYPNGFGSRYLSAYDGKTVERLIKDDVYSFSVRDNIIFALCTCHENVNNNTEYCLALKKYDIEQKTTVEVCEIGAYGVIGQCFTDKYLIFEAYYEDECGVYKLDLETFSEPELIRNDNACKIKRLNVYGTKLYMASEDGLISYDLVSNIETKLSNKNTTECYVLDDKWVYFVDNRSVLRRVTQDGSITETVFG